MKIEVLSSLGENVNFQNMKDYIRYMENIKDGQFNRLSCSNISFLMRGVDKMMRSIGKKEKPKYYHYSKWLKATNCEVRNIMNSIEDRYLDKL